MNKEAIVAILIGIGLGLFGALYFSNFSSPAKNEVNPEEAFSNSRLTPQLTTKAARPAEFNKLPQSGSLVSKNKLQISGKAENNNHLFVLNELLIAPVKMDNSQFEYELSLKPGLNKIILYDLYGEKEQLKMLKLFYFEAQESVLSKNDEENSSKEADLLKSKLEDKVLELRDNPQTVFYGQIKAKTDKGFTLVDGNSSNKINVEPEITNFYRVDKSSLSSITFDDLEKNDYITAFVSDIGGEKISYTVYLEPQTTVVGGKISNLDDDNYTITIVNFDKSSVGADLETETTQNLYNLKNRQVVKGGFSKLAIGQPILAIVNGSQGSYSLSEYLVLQ
jgi:hypothetical protein